MNLTATIGARQQCLTWVVGGQPLGAHASRRQTNVTQKFSGCWIRCEAALGRRIQFSCAVCRKADINVTNLTMLCVDGDAHRQTRATAGEPGLAPSQKLHVTEPRSRGADPPGGVHDAIGNCDEDETCQHIVTMLVCQVRNRQQRTPVMHSKLMAEDVRQECSKSAAQKEIQLPGTKMRGHEVTNEGVMLVERNEHQSTNTTLEGVRAR